ncbi:hypothetical protein LIA77_02312 [Sarocladium implicatum]|nr:hypothetical protein LIA77_02312 [Sarocladium implicatum]
MSPLAHLHILLHPGCFFPIGPTPVSHHGTSSTPRIPLSFCLPYHHLKYEYTLVFPSQDTLSCLQIIACIVSCRHTGSQLSRRSCPASPDISTFIYSIYYRHSSIITPSQLTDRLWLLHRPLSILVSIRLLSKPNVMIQTSILPLSICRSRRFPSSL